MANPASGLRITTKRYIGGSVNPTYSLRIKSNASFNAIFLGPRGAFNGIRIGVNIKVICHFDTYGLGSRI